MSSETTMVDEQCRLREWAAQQMVPVRPELLQHQEREDGNLQSGLDISIKGFSIHVTESTSMPLLESVLKAVRHA